LGEKKEMPHLTTHANCLLNYESKTARKAAKIGIMIFLISILAFSSVRLAYGETFELTLATTKQVYSAGDRIIINGSLTLNQNPVSDALVTVQVDDARGYLRILRTIPTGTNITKSWPVEIINVVPISSGGPVYKFTRGSDVGFNVTIKNNDFLPHDVNLTICIYYPDEVPLRTAIMWNGTIDANQTMIASSFPFATISTTAPLGTAVAYVNIIHPPLPKDGGFAYAPEKSVAFDIVSSTTPPSFPASPEGTFNLAFAVPRVNARLGNYTVYATSFYLVGPYPYFASSSLTFRVIILGDLNGDGICDIIDIAIVAKAYGSYPGQHNWNPVADLYPDLIIDVMDIARVAKDYGKSGIYP
jgi:hypothetical protein